MWNVLTSQGWTLYQTLLKRHEQYDPHRIARIIVRAHHRAERRDRKAWEGWMRYTQGNFVIIHGEQR